MDIFDLVRSCIRHWYAFVPLLVLTIAACFAASKTATPVYERTSSYLIASQAIPASADLPSNPIGEPSDALAALVQQLNSPQVTDPLTGDGTTGMTVTAAPGDHGPILVLTASGKSAEQVNAALQSLGRTAQSNLSTLQAQVKSPSQVSYQLVQLESGSLPIAYPSRLRSIALVGLAGLLATVSITQFVAARVQRRKSRRARNGSNHVKPAVTTDAPIATGAGDRSSVLVSGS